MKKRVAAIVTEYRPHSHADVIVGKLAEPFLLDGVLTEPRLDVVSLYTDQVPENDMSREVAARHNIPIVDSIAEALTLGGADLAVDGVVLVGEHGRYPKNARGQILYPRRRFFEETVAVMRRCGRVVPIFSDKHLSYSWENAEWIYNTTRELKIPFLAGSSLPLTWRRPPLEVPRGAAIDEALGIAYGALDAYGFHALEMIQCMVERRRGAETGVAAVQCIEGPAVWEAARAGRWSADLFDAACSRLAKPPEGTLQEHATSPAAYLVEYRDGLRATVLMLNGAVSEFTFAARINGAVQSTQFFLEGEPYGHFAFLVRAIEDLIINEQAPYPVERTLLTTGTLALALESRYRDGIRMPTPELAIEYKG